MNTSASQIRTVDAAPQPAFSDDADACRLSHRRDLKERLLQIHLDDGEVLKHLISMTAAGEDLSALYIIPLVEVAWADGVMDERERAAILPVVEAEGMCSASTGARLLAHWLREPPARGTLEVWNDYVRTCYASMCGAQKQEFREMLTRRAHAIAEAAGGVLGLGNRVSRLECEILGRMDEAFA